MQRNSVLGRAALVWIAVVAFAANAVALSAQEQDFVLVNETGVDIYSVFITPHESDDWEEDILGLDVLLDGEEVEIVFHRSETAQWWDLRVEDDEGNSIEWENLNLFEILSVTLFYDPETGRAWAEVEIVDGDGVGTPRRLPLAA